MRSVAGPDVGTLALLIRIRKGEVSVELRIETLSKTYPNGVKALDNVSLTIPHGMYGLLGPNGAGKTTLMRTVATLQEPDGGSIHLGKVDVLRQKDEVRRQLGYLPQDFGVYPRISAEDMLSHLALLKGIANSGERKDLVEAMLRRCNLYDVRKKSLTSFSGGMRQRFGIAQALIGNPQLLIVDEPTAGLDPGERNRFYNLLAEVGEDVVDMCSRMAILHLGKVLFEGQPADAIAQLRDRVWRRSIAKSELPDYERRYQVISSKLAAGR